MSKKSIDDLIRSVDEPEDSLDNAARKEEAPAKADTPAPDAPLEQPETRADPDDDKDKSGLPPWMHARVKAAAEAKTAAEKRAEQAEARAAERERQLEEMQRQAQQNGFQPVQQERDPEQELRRAIKDTQIDVSRRLASSQFGEETVEEAIKWATARCNADPQFNQMMWDTPAPAFLAVQEFQKAQAYMELERYGGDINKLIEAKLAERGGLEPDPSPQESKRKLPSNFSTAPAATAQRGGPAFKGPTPLGDLLKS
jgi:hypothetical protein